MAEAAVATPQELQAQERQSQQEQERSRVHPMDPDFLLLAFPLALLLDLLSYVFMGLDAGIVAAVINIVLGGLLVLWMVLRGMRLDQAKQPYKQAVKTARMGKAGLQPRRAAAQQMARAGGRRVSSKLLRRALIMYVGNSIPILNFIPFWTIGVILTLREK